jgi:dihydroorotate dehydrogenase (NAD+) catalytic subunit
MVPSSQLVRHAALPELSADLSFIRLRNPVVGASGVFGVETARVVDLSHLGAVVTKTQFVAKRPGNPLPRIVETPAGTLNSVGIPCLGADHFIEVEWPTWRQAGCPVIVSVGGESEDDYFEMVERLEQVPGIPALELNISCPNQAAGGLEFGASSRSVERVVRGVVDRTRRPVIAKLTPNVTSIAEIARAAEAGGASALCAINTLVGMSLDVRRRRSRLGSLRGGLAGPAIRPIAVRCVWEASRATGLPVIATGGAETAEDVLEFILAGAIAVAVGTAAFYDLAALQRLPGEIASMMSEIGVARLEELRGCLEQPGLAHPVGAG